MGKVESDWHLLPEADDQVHFEDGQLLVPLRISSD